MAETAKRDKYHHCPKCPRFTWKCREGADCDLPKAVFCDNHRPDAATTSTGDKGE